MSTTTAVLSVKIDADGKTAERELAQASDAVAAYAKDVNAVDLGPAMKEVTAYGSKLDGLNSDFKATGKKADELGEKFGSTASRTGQTAGAFGDLGGALSSAGGPLGAIGSGMEALAPFIMGVTGAADLAEVATGALSLKQGAAAAASEAQAAATAQATVATEAQTGAQGILNAVMSANPILLVVLAIVALVAIFILAYKKSALFRDIVHEILDVVQDVAGAIATGFTAALAFLIKWVPLALAIIFPFIGVPLLIAQHFGQIKGYLTGALGDAYSTVQTWIGKILTFVTGIPGKIVSAFKDIGSAIAGTIADALNDVLHLPLEIPGFKVGPVHFGGLTLIPRLNAAQDLADELDDGYRPPALRLLGSSGFGSSAVDLGGSGAGGSFIAGGTVNVNFYGLVTDPVGVARQIKSILAADDVRQGQAA